MLQRLLSCALLAGLVTGLLMSALHGVYTTPLIERAETYEGQAAQAHAGGGHVHHDTGQAAAGHHHGAAWTPEGWARSTMTLVAAIASTVGFALMLLAGAVFLRGNDINAWSGLGFGLAGFAATSLATSLGLAPELPGAAAGDLFLRQAWWIGTAAATLVGLGALVFARQPSLKALGLVALVVPHLIGAPEAAAPASQVPAELSALFTARSLVLQGVMWAVLGMSCGWLWQRQASRVSHALPV